eukprot:scaffold11360_cov114-Isochrysis_galbana.AAC.2
MSASEHELSLCPGLGPTKVRRLTDAFHAPFIPKFARAGAQPQHAGVEGRPGGEVEQGVRDGRGSAHHGDGPVIP